MFIIYNRRKHLGTRYTKQQQILLQSNEKYNACYVVSLFFCKAVRCLYSYLVLLGLEWHLQTEHYVHVRVRCHTKGADKDSQE